MPLKLFAGISKKTGLPNYGSLGASCHVEVELDGSLSPDDLDTFHRHVRRTYAACADAVNKELARHRAAPADGPAGNGRNGPDDNAPGSNGAGHARDGNGQAGNGQAGTGPDGQVSARQIDYVRLLVGQIRGLGVRRLEAICRSMFGRPLPELSRQDVSTLIDTLKDVRTGKTELATVLTGAAP